MPFVPIHKDNEQLRAMSKRPRKRIATNPLKKIALKEFQGIDNKLYSLMLIFFGLKFTLLIKEKFEFKHRVDVFVFFSCYYLAGLRPGVPVVDGKTLHESFFTTWKLATVSSSLNRLAGMGFIEGVQNRGLGCPANERGRLFYQITEYGYKVLREEVPSVVEAWQAQIVDNVDESVKRFNRK